MPEPTTLDLNDPRWKVAGSWPSSDQNDPRWKLAGVGKYSTVYIWEDDGDAPPAFAEAKQAALTAARARFETLVATRDRVVEGIDRLENRHTVAFDTHAPLAVVLASSNHLLSLYAELRALDAEYDKLVVYRDGQAYLCFRVAFSGSMPPEQLVEPLAGVVEPLVVTHAETSPQPSSEEPPAVGS